MKSALHLVLAVTVLAPVALLAQDERSKVRAEVDRELGQLYRKSKASRVASVRGKSYRISQNEGVNFNSPSSSSSSISESSSTTYVIQPSDEVITQTSETVNVVQPPVTTVVEDTPLKSTKADELRKKRSVLEKDTEEKLVQTLEDERAMSEQERADRVLKGLKKKEELNPAAAGAVQSMHSSETLKTTETNTSETSLSEIEDESDDEGKSRFFIGALGGLADYPGLKNVRGVYAYGLSLGMILPERFVAEITYVRATLDIENFQPFYYYSPAPRVTQMDQDMYAGAFKYQLLPGKFTPVVGAAVAYTKRKFTDRQVGPIQGASTGNSSTFDAGLVGGLDVSVAKNFTLSLDARYYFNLSYRRDQNLESFGGNQGAGTSPIETNSYYLLGLLGKIVF